MTVVSSQLLHQAADKIRATSGNLAGPLQYWRSSGTTDNWDVEEAGYMVGDTHVTVEDANGARAYGDHLVMWSPAVALAVATWLDQEAERVFFPVHDDKPERVHDRPGADANHPAVRVALQILDARLNGPTTDNEPGWERNRRVRLTDS